MPSRRPDLPYDLIIIGAITVAAGWTVTEPSPIGTPIRGPFALLFMLFVPGYAVVTFLFPRRGTGTNRTGHNEKSGHIELADRFVLSFAMSVAIVILVGLGLGTIGRIEPVPVYLSLAVITTLGAIAAAVRRQRVHQAERFAPGTHARQAYRVLFATPSTGGNLLTGLFVLTVVTAAVGIGYGVPLTPAQGDTGFTEFYLLPTESGDRLEPSDYPGTLDTANGTTLTVGIKNREGQSVTYTLVVLLQQTVGEDNLTITRESELYRDQIPVDDDQSREITHQIEPSFTGHGLRLVYLLYTDTPPQDPRIENAYRELHLWVDVTGSETTALGRHPHEPDPSAIDQSRRGEAGSIPEFA